MSAECYPFTVLPHVSRLYADYLAMAEPSANPALATWYPFAPMSNAWMGRDIATAHPEALADALHAQNTLYGAGEETLANVRKLRNGARAVVTGQQVGLFGGPLLTLLKAATAVARAREATAATGIDHVPVFWLATEDHDLAEVNQVAIPSKTTLETLRLPLADTQAEVGSVVLPPLADTLEQVSGLLNYAPVCDLLAECYQPGRSLGEAFARLMTRLFAGYGLVVLDAAGRDFHRLGKSTLEAAITRAAELEEALLARTGELTSHGYHAQVLVKPGASLLFLVDPESGARNALRRTADGWRAAGRSYTTAELLAILDATPERLSPNALLRPVFQDTILPTSAYVGGPAEIAYFAQSAVLYERMLGRLPAVLPRFSATILTPAVAAVMDRHEVSLGQVFEARTADALAQRLGARAMPIEGKRRLAAAGNAMDAELIALTAYLDSLDKNLGRSAAVSASKMRYQMNRLRRMAATFEVQKEASLRKHAEALMLQLFPHEHPQERVVAGVYLVAQANDLIDRLVREAGEMCVGHGVVRL